MAISKITTRGISGDTLEAGDIAANAVGASELADNAVDTAAIAATSITEAKLNADVTDGSAIQTGVKPHIQPNTLYPAWEGYLSDHSSAYEFYDSSPDTLTVNAFGGSVRHTPHQTKMQNTSMRFNGVDDRLEIAHNADWDWGTGDFTVEFWVRPTGSIGGAENIIARKNNSTDCTFYLRFESGKLNWAAGGDHLSPSTSDFAVDNWYHVAFVKASGTMTCYKNGTSLYTFSDSVNYSSNTDSTSAISIGCRKLSGAYIQFGEFYLDELRITKGLAVYAGNFTAPTGAFTTTWSANPFGGSNTAANSTAGNVGLLIHSAPTGRNSGAYGTAQSDSKSYYYTDIKGSKPIKDPRIGAHFGSQRHKFTSLQLLEQETAAHGKEVHSVDGREWIRTVQDSNKWYVENGSSGVFLNVDSNATGMFFEVTGYFNDINLLGQTASDRANDVDITVNGDSASRVDGATTFDTTTASPLGSRYVSGSSLINLGSKTALGSSTLKAELGTTPAINTVKIMWMATSIYERISGIELITQDTTSTANKSKIQIPAQNVVSYGKKFSVSAATPHYDPFNGFTSGNLAAVQALVDTDTSLGIANWLHSSTYYRPYNGGRVVKWIASDGTIKTSVTVMPPNAQNITGSAISAKANASVANNTYLPTFSGTIDHSLSEVAKTYWVREFGNGNANGGAGGTYKDLSMQDTSADNLGFVMDDGLTSASGADIASDTTWLNVGNSNGDKLYVTFIGTGISYAGGHSGKPGPFEPCQNLSYGTHILMIERDTSAGDGGNLVIDNVNVYDDATTALGNYGIRYPKEFSFYQPKMPPIPEDAVIISDYMLMADHVQKTANASNIISKGVRLLDSSRDFHHDTSSGSMLLNNAQNSDGYPFRNYMNSGSGAKLSKVSAFATNFGIDAIAAVRGKPQINGSDVLHTDVGTHVHPNAAVTLGNNLLGWQAESNQDGGFFRFEIATPTHTSSHYQPFETPYLHELVGGDRNMEQNNLIVTPDGKSWDEVTRDTDYIGAQIHRVNTDTGVTSTTAYAIFDEHRGVPSNSGGAMGWKNWVHGYDREICLRNGTYKITTQTIRNGATSYHGSIYLNGSAIVHGHSGSSNHDTITTGITRDFKRGDYIQIRGCRQGDMLYSKFEIVRLEN